MAPKIHLPEPVLGMDISLAEKQVMVSGRIDLGNSIAIPVNPDLAVQAIDLDLSVNYGKGFQCGSTDKRRGDEGSDRSQEH